MPPVSLLLPLLVAVLAGACTDPPARPADGADPPPASVPYRLAAPDTIVALAPVLREVSGLTMLPSGRLAAVQDERGTVFELDPATGAILRATPFQPTGDFEGIAWAGDALWTLESDGTLSRLVAGAPVERVATPLSSRNDAEGLAWDPVSRRLLIACKGHPGDGLGAVRALYAFDPVARRLEVPPAYTLDRAAVDAPRASFRPSAVAVHPQSGALYVLSATRRALAMVDARNGEVVALAPFPDTLLPQPEGLAFAPDGTMYVASEGPNGPATLVRYGPSAD